MKSFWTKRVYEAAKSKPLYEDKSASDFPGRVYSVTVIVKTLFGRNRVPASPRADENKLFFFNRN